MIGPVAVLLLMLLLAVVPAVMAALVIAFSIVGRLRNWRFNRRIRLDSENYSKAPQSVRFIPAAARQATLVQCQNQLCAALNQPYARFCRQCGYAYNPSKEAAT